MVAIIVLAASFVGVIWALRAAVKHVLTPGAGARPESRQDPMRIASAAVSTWTALDDHQLTRYLDDASD